MSVPAANKETPMHVGKAQDAPKEGGGHDSRYVVPCFTQIDEAQIRDHLERDHFFWLDLTAPSREDLHRLGALFGFHPLALEDSEEFGQRPKLDNYGDYVFLVFYGALPEPSQETGLYQLDPPAVHHLVVLRRRHGNGPSEMIRDAQAHLARIIRQVECGRYQTTELCIPDMSQAAVQACVTPTRRHGNAHTSAAKHRPTHTRVHDDRL